MGGPGTVTLQISRGALRHNFGVLEQAARFADEAGAAATELLGVIKADAYGHGAEMVSGVLAAGGARWLGVTDAREGARVRRAVGDVGGDGPRILVMCGLVCAEEARLCAEHGLVPVVWTVEQVRLLAEEAGPVDVHVEVDSGMARVGVGAGAEMEALLRAIAATEGRVRLGGVLTHFASAEVAGAAQTAEQQRRFGLAAEQVERSGLLQRDAVLHAGNTSTLDEGGVLPFLREMAQKMGVGLLARTGLALYGYSLPLEGQGAVSRLSGRLRPVARWMSRVLSVRLIGAGETVGYNGAYVTGRPTRVALVAVGYADGLRREMSSTTERAGGWVLVRGERAPILGRVSMNLLTVDVTEIAGVAAGDEAVLLGAAPAMTAEDQARLAGTIAYEILCGMRGERVLVE